MARETFEARQTSELRRAVATLARLVALLDQHASPGDRMMLLAETDEAARIAYVAAGTLKAYQSRAASRQAAGRILGP